MLAVQRNNSAAKNDGNHDPDARRNAPSADMAAEHKLSQTQQAEQYGQYMATGNKVQHRTAVSSREDPRNILGDVKIRPKGKATERNKQFTQT